MISPANTEPYFGSKDRNEAWVAEAIWGHRIERQACGFRQFLMRGLNKVAAEWAMLCTVHNINKLAGAQRSMKPA